MEAAIIKKIPKALGYGRFIFIENSKSRIQTSQRGTEQPENIYIFRLYPNIIYEILIHIDFWLWNAKMIITKVFTWNAYHTLVHDEKCWCYVF